MPRPQDKDYPLKEVIQIRRMIHGLGDRLQEIILMMQETKTAEVRVRGAKNALLDAVRLHTFANELEKGWALSAVRDEDVNPVDSDDENGDSKAPESTETV